MNDEKEWRRRYAKESDVLLTHRLEADGKSDLDISSPDFVRDRGHGHESTRAKAVDHLDGHAFREASSEGGSTNVVTSVVRQKGAEANVTYARGVDVGACDDLLLWFEDTSDVS